MRTVTSNSASISLWLAPNTVVYVTGQLYNEGYGWHITNYLQYAGYARADQLRKLSDSEVQAYLQSVATPTPTPAATVKPYDPYAASSYGRVTSSTVNFRATPSTTGAKLKTLRQYAFGLVIGSQVVNGQTWYNINHNGTIGWVDGRYFGVLNLTELSSFLNSKEYLSGLVNNGIVGSTTGGTSGGTSGTSGSATQGQVSSVEDWNLGVWKNPNAGVNASYEPFNPYATPTAPLVSATPTPTPTATFVVGTMIPIPYDDQTKETQTDNGWVGLAIGGIVLLGGAGGVYAYALNQNKKRRLAAHNAAMSRRNAQQGGTPPTGAGSATSSPYTRHAVAAPPVAGTMGRQNQNGTAGATTGTYPSQSPYSRGPGQSPYASGTTANPYARPAQEQNPYVRPAGETRPADGAPTGAQSTADAGRPVSGNPFAQPTPGGNPYARPTTPNPFAAGSSTGAADGDEPANPTPRRTSRASRYQGQDGGDSDT